MRETQEICLNTAMFYLTTSDMPTQASYHRLTTVTVTVTVTNNGTYILYKIKYLYQTLSLVSLGAVSVLVSVCHDD